MKIFDISTKSVLTEEKFKDFFYVTNGKYFGVKNKRTGKKQGLKSINEGNYILVGKPDDWDFYDGDAPVSKLGNHHYYDYEAKGGLEVYALRVDSSFAVALKSGGYICFKGINATFEFCETEDDLRVCATEM